MQIVTAFQVKHLPADVDKAFEPVANGASATTKPAAPAPASVN
jgi:hypothetical protein